MGGIVEILNAHRTLKRQMSSQFFQVLLRQNLLSPHLGTPRHRPRFYQIRLLFAYIKGRSRVSRRWLQASQARVGRTLLSDALDVPPSRFQPGLIANTFRW